jgi:hypothetical protein
MRNLTKTLLIALAFGLASPALADQAKKKRGGKAGAKAGGGHEKVITREATMKGKDSTKVDFEAADIGGARKMPLGDTINQNKADKNYDFVKIRLRWHPEMVQSASTLDSGNTK